MSWSVSYPTAEAFANDEPTTTSGTPPDDQLKAARSAAQALIASEAVGDPFGDYAVQLSGHANPGHVPADGWANDCITVTVSQKTPTSTATSS